MAAYDRRYVEALAASHAAILHELETYCADLLDGEDGEGLDQVHAVIEQAKRLAALARVEGLPKREE